ncbi:SusC/RagA family TonB-linked outer membrane protein [Polaribacter sp. ALD11]|uniref:SusC/RagA family TonB-linked outer membrane protein n=1 Tax=Polaribacter sp. ALD11 TaxID=2058137 RepID=UPI000C303D16|nr:SusC/RagA family TonB-linked outer membrane protein [Polaribacter sp. ALD11]AUC84439.1 SusC/RagA family TonB-linked outer membrane protein [Polaribacter sp. ALD11]
MKHNFLILMSFFLSTIAFSQQVLSGKILDETGGPLPGATVNIINGDKWTSSDFDGNFTIEYKNEKSIIKIAYLGYVSQEITIGKRKSISITLQPEDNMLNEIIVTALGIKRTQKKVGYATQKVDAAAVKEITAPNVAGLITGKVSGLTVSNPTGLFQAPSFTLRGKTPLIVVDGIPVSTDFYDISPDDILEITVLKGTSASALYGYRGGNGAIQITTSKGKKSDGLEITVAHNIMVSAGFTVFPETQTAYGNGSNGKYEFWDGQDGGISDGDMIWGPKFEPGVKISQWNSPILDNTNGEVTPWWGDVSGTKYDDKSRYSRVPTPWKYHNNLKDFLKTGVMNTTSFSVANSTEKGSYRVSGNYKSHTGRVPNTSIKSGGLTFNSSTKLSDKLTLDSKLAYNKVFSPNYPRHGYGPKNHMYTILIWMGDDVNGKELNEHRYIPGQEGYRQANYNYAWYNNVYFAAHELNQRYDSNVLNGQLKLNYQISDDFSMQAMGSSVMKDRFENRESPKSYLNYGDPRDGDYKTWNTNSLDVDYNLLMTYNKDISDRFSLSANAGASSEYHKYQQEYNATDGIIVPELYSLNNTKGNIKGNTHFSERSVNSVYGMLELDFDNKLFLTFTGRTDKHSVLPKNNNSLFYPSVSLSTMVSEWFDLPESINYLKVFGSWAQVKRSLDAYQINSYYNNAGMFNGSPVLSYPGGLVNPDIEGSLTTNVELGLSAGFLNNRISLDFAYYNAIDEDSIINLPISLGSGFSSRKENAHQFTTNGYEVSVRATPIKNDNFRWDVLTNWSKKVQRVTRLDEGAEKYNDLKLNERTDAFYATVWEKSADGQLILDSKTSMPTKNAYKQNIGNKNPDWRLGLENTFKYKDFSLKVGVDGVWGGLLRSRTVEKMWWGGKHPNSTIHRDAEYKNGIGTVYTPTGVNVTGGSVQKDLNGNITSDTRTYSAHTTPVSWQSWSQNYPYRAQVTSKESKIFANVFDRTYFKLRTVALSYDLNKVIKAEGFKQINASLNGYNLFIWKKADIIDPDFGDDDNLQDPSTRYLGLGLTFKF